MYIFLCTILTQVEEKIVGNCDLLVVSCQFEQNRLCWTFVCVHVKLAFGLTPAEGARGLLPSAPCFPSNPTFFFFFFIYRSRRHTLLINGHNLQLKLRINKLNGGEKKKKGSGGEKKHSKRKQGHDMAMNEQEMSYLSKTEIFSPERSKCSRLVMQCGRTDKWASQA